MENMQEIIEKYELKSGSHASIKKGACVMELVSYIAGEKWSDHPQCACPILTKFAIRYNDRVDDKERQRLKLIIPKLLNSRNKEKELPRARFFALRAVTVFLPELTDALDLKEISAKLRSFTTNDFPAARDYIYDQRSVIREAMKNRLAKVNSAAAAAYADADAAAAYAYADAAAAASASASAYASAYAAASAAYAAYADADAAAARKDMQIKILEYGMKLIEKAR